MFVGLKWIMHWVCRFILEWWVLIRLEFGSSNLAGTFSLQLCLSPMEIYRNLLVDLATPGCLEHLLTGHTVWWPGWDTFMAAAVTAANMIKRRRCIAAWHVYIHRHAVYILLALAYGSFALQLPKMAFSNQVWHMIIDRIKICKATIAILQGEFACTRHLVKGLSTHLTHRVFCV